MAYYGNITITLIIICSAQYTIFCAVTFLRNYVFRSVLGNRSMEGFVDWGEADTNTCQILGEVNITSLLPVSDHHILVSVLPQSCSPEYDPIHVHINPLFLMVCYGFIDL